MESYYVDFELNRALGNNVYVFICIICIYVFNILHVSVSFCCIFEQSTKKPCRCTCTCKTTTNPSICKTKTHRFLTGPHHYLHKQERNSAIQKNKRRQQTDRAPDNAGIFNLFASQKPEIRTSNTNEFLPKTCSPAIILPERARRNQRKTRCFVSFVSFFAPPLLTTNQLFFSFAKSPRGGGAYLAAWMRLRANVCVCVCPDSLKREGGRGREEGVTSSRLRHAGSKLSSLALVRRRNSSIYWSAGQRKLTTTSPGAHLTHNPTRNHPERLCPQWCESARVPEKF